jgi:putative oxidoreductase
MSNIIQKWQSWAPYLRSLLRIVTAIMFMQVGTMKLFGFPMSMPGGITAPLFSEIWFAGFLEVVGGVFILVGFCTRPVAFVLSGEMAVAYFQAHAAKSFWTVINGGASAVLFCFVFLYFSSAGAGHWSIDAMLYRRRLKRENMS